MGVSRGLRLRVGVIGLGRLWEARHKPALLKLSDRFQVTAVYDQVARRAELEAGQLGCAAVGGLLALIGRQDVDVVYLLNPQWFGLHALGLACEAKKPIYCALPLAGYPLEELTSVAEQVVSSGVPFMPEFARRFYPATPRLKELLATKLGAPRLILGHLRLFGFDRYGPPGPTTQTTPAPLLVDPGSYLLDWCCHLFQAPPLTAEGSRAVVLKGDGAEAAGSEDFESFALGFERGGLAQLSYGRYHRQAWGDATRFLPGPGFQVFAERGAAWVELPDRIQWSDASGTHEERLPLEPTVGELLNRQFHRLVQGEPAEVPTIRDALTVARLVESVATSQSEGRRVALGPGESG